MTDKTGYEIGYIGAPLVEKVLSAWPEKDWCGWYAYSGERGEKLASKPGSVLPSPVYAALWHMASLITVDLMDDILGDSFIDHHLHAAGMHWILPGGSLPRHLDAERHPDRSWRRTHSVVCFLDSMDDGGELVLDDGAQVITPNTPGQVVAFRTSGNWHWVNMTHGDRRTLALFGWEKCSGSELAQQRDRALFVPSSSPRSYSLR